MSGLSHQDVALGTNGQMGCFSGSTLAHIEAMYKNF